MSSLIMSAAFLLTAAATPIPVILDTDLGDDIDDTWALAMLLGSPQVDVKLIVTASDDTPTKTRLVAKILEGMGRTDILLAQGVKVLLHMRRRRGQRGLVRSDDVGQNRDVVFQSGGGCGRVR